MQFDAIGTQWTIELLESAANVSPAEVEANIRGRIEVFDKDYSRFRDDSLVMSMARTAGTYLLPADAQPLLSIYRRVYELTDGAVTPLVGQVLVDAGYDAEYSFTPRKLSQPPDWETVLTYQHPHLTLHEPAILDFGAAGKGYLIDIVANILRESGVGAFCIDAGGDILYEAHEPLRVGLENPHDSHEAIGLVEFEGGSICASAGNRRAWGQYHHILDPHRLISPKHLDAVWVTADNALTADILTTALYFVPPAALREYSFEYAMLRPDGRVEYSPNFPGTFFEVAD